MPSARASCAITVGFLLVILFMLLYYKGSGINAAVAQIVNLLIMIGVLSAFGLTLSLASIAGFVLTIGMSVDANVLVFERMKEELREGKGRVASIRAGFNKAFWTIMDSNITTLIAALFLAQLGSGPIQGFAISLSIGTISSLFTALFVSHLIFDFETEVLHSQAREHLLEGQMTRVIAFNKAFKYTVPVSLIIIVVRPRGAGDHGLQHRRRLPGGPQLRRVLRASLHVHDLPGRGHDEPPGEQGRDYLHIRMRLPETPSRIPSPTSRTRRFRPSPTR